MIYLQQQTDIALFVSIITVASVIFIGWMIKVFLRWIEWVRNDPNSRCALGRHDWGKTTDTTSGTTMSFVSYGQRECKNCLQLEELTQFASSMSDPSWKVVKHGEIQPPDRLFVCERCKTEYTVKTYEDSVGTCLQVGDKFPNVRGPLCHGKLVEKLLKDS